MSNFALDTNSSQGDIVSSLNYALANLGNNNINATGNVLTANVQTGAISTGGNTVSYLYQYMNVAYGNSATGSGFTSNSAYTSYYGIHNTTANVVDTNPADYQWTQVAGGFGTTKHLYYQTLGGRQISFNVNTTAPTYFVPVQDNTPINLDVVTGTTGANGAPGANGIPGSSNYNFPVYTWANIAPATPQANTGSWNFTTGVGTPPSDPGLAFAANSPGNVSVAVDSTYLNSQINVIAANSTYNWTFTTVYSTANVAGSYNIGSNNNWIYPGTGTVYVQSGGTNFVTVNINGNSGNYDVFMVGGGGPGAGKQYTYGTLGAAGQGGSGGSYLYTPGVFLSNTTNYAITAGYTADTVFGYGSGTSISPIYTAAAGKSGYQNFLSNIYGGNGAVGTGTTYSQGVANGYKFPGGAGVADPWNQITWAGAIQSNGVAYFGGGGGGGSSGKYGDSGGIGGGGTGYQGNIALAPTGGIWGGGGGSGENISLGAGSNDGNGSAGIIIFRSLQYSQGANVATWSTTIPANPGYGNLYVAQAYAQIQGNTGIAGNLTWSTPQQLNGPTGQRGVFTSAYVVTASDPTFYSASDYTTAFEAPRTAATPPIGTGYTPLTGDTASFTYRPTNTVVTKTFYANINQWLSANTQVISGNLFVSNSVTASALITTDVYPLNIVSQNATIGSFASPGFWLQASSGNARLAGTTSIGNNLAVGNNAVIGNNLTVGSSAAIGNNLAIGNNAVIANSLLVGNNATIGNNLAIGSNGTIGSNLAIGNNLVIGNNALVGNNMVIGNNLLIGNSASIASNLVVGNNAVIGGNLTILGLVSGGNLRSNVVNTTNIVYNAITASQMAPASVAAAAIQSASILSRMFTSNCVPATALTPGASTRVLTVSSTADTAPSPPTAGSLYGVGNTLIANMNVGDVIYITATVYGQLSFTGPATADTEYTINLQVGIQLPDSSIQYSQIGSSWYQVFDTANNVLNFPATTVNFGFTATQSGSYTFGMVYGYDTNIAGSPAPAYLNLNFYDGISYTPQFTYPAIITGILAPYVG